MIWYHSGMIFDISHHVLEYFSVRIGAEFHLVTDWRIDFSLVCGSRTALSEDNLDELNWYVRPKGLISFSIQSRVMLPFFIDDTRDSLEFKILVFIFFGRSRLFITILQIRSDRLGLVFGLSGVRNITRFVGVFVGVWKMFDLTGVLIALPVPLPVVNDFAGDFDMPDAKSEKKWCVESVYPLNVSWLKISGPWFISGS